MRWLRCALPVLAAAFFVGCSGVQDSTIIRSYGNSLGINCDIAETIDPKVVTIVAACRDEWDGGKLVVSSASTQPNATFTDFFNLVAEFGMGVVTPIVAGLAL